MQDELGSGRVEQNKVKRCAADSADSADCRRFSGAPRSDRLPLCFTGHIDTVPLGATAWNYDPFAGEIAGDKVYGRGSTDMKSGVAAMIATATQLTHFQTLQAGLTLILTAGEETCCQGAYHLASLDNVLGEAGAIVVGEPTANYPWIGHKGAV